MHAISREIFIIFIYFIQNLLKDTKKTNSQHWYLFYIALNIFVVSRRGDENIEKKSENVNGGEKNL